MIALFQGKAKGFLNIEAIEKSPGSHSIRGKDQTIFRSDLQRRRQW
jgi:hypothetical protein